jgi:cell division protein FtsI/penicillin-binding protein 2
LNEEDNKIANQSLSSDSEPVVFYNKFANDVGPAVYRNRAVSDIYEPGSVFKVIAMAIGIDAAGLTPDRQINDFGPIKVDQFTIDNALGKHYGLINMTQVLETSNNIGMAFVAKEIGRSLFGVYLKKFGFGNETEIELPDQESGQIESSQRWSEAELVTHGFGQGISVTPIQMITALAALANDGVMMKPYIVDKMVEADRLINTEPRVIRQVISKESADKIKAMMVSVVENGQQRKVLGTLPYTIAGKTGTSQTYKRGIPLEGAGTTIATYGGFAPADDPKFVVLVKLDKPKTSQWADATAVPLFKKVAEFMFDYLAIPPDKI